MKVNLIQLPASNGRLPQPITVAAGQVIRVQVVKSEGSQVWLRLGGQVIKADSRAQLNPGDRLQLQVAGVRPDLIELRILPETDPAAGKPAPLTAGLGLPLNPVSQQLVSQLIRFGLPLQPAALAELYTFIKGRQVEGDLVQMLAWLKSIGVKAANEQDVEALAGLQRFLLGDMAENEELRFFQFINQTAAETRGSYKIQGWPLPGGHIYLVTRNPGQLGSSSGEARVLLRVKTALLREVWVELELVRERLQLNFSCLSEPAAEILIREQERLEQVLQTAGYRTGGFRVQVLKEPATILDFIPELPANVGKIDRRA